MLLLLKPRHGVALADHSVCIARLPGARLTLLVRCCRKIDAQLEAGEDPYKLPTPKLVQKQSGKQLAATTAAAEDDIENLERKNRKRKKRGGKRKSK